MKSFPNSPAARDNLARLFTSIGYFGEARRLLEGQKLKDPDTKLLYTTTLALAGEYRKAMTKFKEIRSELPDPFRFQLAQSEAVTYLGLGRIEEARARLQLSTEYARKEEIRYFLHTGTLLLAACYAALRDHDHSQQLLKAPIPVLRKVGSWRDVLLRYLILGKDVEIDYNNLTPRMRLVLLLCNAQGVRNYWQAYRYAHNKGCVAHFHFWLLFFPDLVRKIIRAGRDPRLPKRFLELPVFQTEIPVFHIKLLGPFRIYRNGRPIRTSLPPKSASILIQLALRNGSIPIDSLLNNYWPDSSSPKRNLSHLLVICRRSLKLSTRELHFGRGGRLIFTPPVTTDLQIFSETLTRARLLKNFGEWSFARQEYLRAFRMVRGEPLRKMFDDWSIDTHRFITERIKKAIQDFITECERRNDQEGLRSIRGPLNRLPISLD